MREWRQEDGLPNDHVMQLLQDRRGYLWVAARGALCRFDGSTFLPFGEREAQDIFYGLVEQRDGSVVLAPREGDPLRYRDGVFRREPLPAPFTGRPIGVLFCAPDDALWYSIKGTVLRIAGGSVETFGPTNGISSQSWTRFATDATGHVWLASDRVLARYEHGRLVSVPVEKDSGELRVFSSREGGPWLVTANRVFKLDPAGRLEEIARIPTMLSAHFVNVGTEDRRGLLWLGTRSQGLHVVGPDGAIQVQTSNDTISALLEDRDGTMWVGATTGGLNAISPKVCTLYNKATGLTANACGAVCVDNAGAIWIANGDGGIARIRDGQIDRWQLRIGNRLYAAGSVTRDPEGGVWATGGTGAAVFHVPADGTAISVVGEIPSGGIHATLFTASDGDLWLTTYDRRVGHLHGRVYQTYGPAEGVATNGIRTFGENAKGELLAGTNDGTLLQFDRTRFVPALWHVDVPSAINAIHTIGDNLWLGTASNGLAICHGTKATFVGTAEGLPDDNVTQVMPDDQGNVWCGSGRGVFRVAIADVERVIRGEAAAISPLRLGQDEGLGSIACQGIYGPGVAKTADSRIWFATRQGVLAVDPHAEAFTPPPPTVAIEQVFANDRAQPFTRPWIVDQNARKLEIRFSVLCLSAPSRVVTRYRLVGFDTTWIDNHGARVATYPQLAPGTYRFEVATGFGRSVGDIHTDAIDVIVQPLWWQTSWFRVATVAAGVVGIFLIVRVWSHRRLRRRIENLERETAVARVRARIAQDIHDEVGASLTRISLLTQTSVPNSPEVENLGRIDETAREVTRSLDEIVWAVNPQYDTLESFVGYLTDFAQKFLRTARIRCRLTIPPQLPQFSLPSEVRHDLFLCCREALNNVVKHAAASEVTIRLSFRGPALVVSIADDGRGLVAEPSEIPAERVSAGHGFRNLRDRMARIGGTCTIEPVPTGGTCVTLTVTVQPTSASA